MLVGKILYWEIGTSIDSMNRKIAEETLLQTTINQVHLPLTPENSHALKLFRQGILEDPVVYSLFRPDWYIVISYVNKEVYGIFTTGQERQLYDKRSEVDDIFFAVFSIPPPAQQDGGPRDQYFIFFGRFS